MPPELARRYGIPLTRLSIPAPDVVIPPGAPADGCMLVVISSLQQVAGWQRSILEYTLSTLDVKVIPVVEPKIEKSPHRTIIRTGLRPKTSSPFVGEISHSLLPQNLMGVQYINWMHIESYVSPRTHQLVAKATCDRKTCSCGATLEKVWPLMWEMHF